MIGHPCHTSMSTSDDHNQCTSCLGKAEGINRTFVKLVDYQIKGHVKKHKARLVTIRLMLNNLQNDYLSLNIVIASQTPLQLALHAHVENNQRHWAKLSFQLLQMALWSIHTLRRFHNGGTMYIHIALMNGHGHTSDECRHNDPSGSCAAARKKKPPRIRNI